MSLSLGYLDCILRNIHGHGESCTVAYVNFVPLNTSMVTPRVALLAQSKIACGIGKSSLLSHIRRLQRIPLCQSHRFLMEAHASVS